MKNSKKIVAIALALVMLVGGVIAGTMAWFVDDEQATNTIVVGDVGILLHESNGTDTDDDYREWLADQWMLPSEGNDGNELAKQITVENDGTNDAYVRVKIYVPTNIAGVIHFNQGNDDWTKLNSDSAKAAAKTADVVIDGTNYVEYTLYYTANDGVVDGNNDDNVSGTPVANTITSNAIDSIYLDKYVDCDNVPTAVTYWHKGVALTELDDGTADIIVVAEAIQVAGHDNATDAWVDFEDQVGNNYEYEDYEPYYEPATIAAP